MMDRTFEAVKRAEKECKKRNRQAGISPQESYFLIPSGKQDHNGHLRPDRLDSLKTKLLRRCTGEAVQIKTILVTGTIHGGGTSTTAVNLATSLAADPHNRVLIVDANFRSPNLHRLFNTKAMKGMSELLDVRAEKSFHFKKISHNDLYLFPCGIKRTSSYGNIESNRFRQFLNNVRNSFDYVIFDSAPLSGTPETQTLCSKVDGVIMVVTYDKTRRQVALRSKKELEEAGANILGVVINRKKYYIPDWIYRRL